MSELNKQVGFSVGAVRKNLGISQAELGRRSGLTSAAISKIEKGDRDIAISTAKKLAVALGVGIDYLAGMNQYPDSNMYLRFKLTKLKHRMREIGELAGKGLDDERA